MQHVPLRRDAVRAPNQIYEFLCFDLVKSRDAEHDLLASDFYEDVQRFVRE